MLGIVLAFITFKVFVNAKCFKAFAYQKSINAIKWCTEYSLTKKDNMIKRYTQYYTGRQSVKPAHPHY
jgi:hypothetical protein